MLDYQKDNLKMFHSLIDLQYSYYITVYSSSLATKLKLKLKSKRRKLNFDNDNHYKYRINFL